MRILLFTDADVFAGTERHMLELGLGLRDLGMRPRLAAPSPSVLQERAAAAGLEFIAIAKGGTIDRNAIDTIARLLSAGEIDVVHAHNGRTHLSAVLAVRKAGRGKVVHTQHFLEPGYATKSGLKGLVFRLAHHWVSRQTAHSIAISEAVRAALLSRREASAERVTVVYNGISPADPASLRDASDVRRELGVGGEAPLVFCAARLEPEKNLGALVSAMGEVVRTHPSAVCVVAGNGRQEEALRAQIGAAKLEDSFKLLGFRQDVMSLARAADVFILPSTSEAFGLVILEAMALAKPVIAARAGGPAEIVVHGETGLLTESPSPEDLAEALNCLLADAPLRQRMGQAGLQRFEELFTTAHMAEATARVYEKVLGLTADSAPHALSSGAGRRAADAATLRPNGAQPTSTGS